MRRTLTVLAVGLALTASNAGIASAAPGDSRVTANGTYQTISADGDRGPILHGRRTYTMGNGEGVRMISGSCKTVDADGTWWGPLWTRGGRVVSCYGANWES